MSQKGLRRYYTQFMTPLRIATTTLVLGATAVLWAGIPGCGSSCPSALPSAGDSCSSDGTLCYFEDESPCPLAKCTNGTWHTPFLPGASESCEPGQSCTYGDACGGATATCNSDGRWESKTSTVDNCTLPPSVGASSSSFVTSSGSGGFGGATGGNGGNGG